MKHNPNPRRPRNRGNGKRHIPVRNQSFESNGPEGKIRGTAQQVLDKYLALGRDALSAGDPIAAEGFYQHAEHYFRLLSAEDVRESERNARATPLEIEPAGDAEPVKVNGPDAAGGSNGNGNGNGADRLPF
ncbi:MAG TPA: DUF4167 domain-containing protein [Defluviicoccus sp.]|nr:DUF4167 domain-containing protein [Defluviicoccus sp.]